MKNKHKVLFGLLIVMVSIFALTDTSFITKVSSKPLFEEPKEELKKGICLKEGLNNVRAESKYHPYVYIPSHFPDEGYVTVSIKSGVFDVYVYEVIDGKNHKEPPLQQFVLGGGQSKSRNVNYTLRDVPVDYAIVLVLRESDNLCSVGPNTKPIQNDNGTWTTSDGTGYIYYYHLGLPSDKNSTEIDNLNYNGICSTLRTGDYAKYADKFSKAGLGQADFDKYRTQIDFPYCNKQRVEYNYSERETAQIIRNKVAEIKIANMYNEQQKPSVPGDATIVDGDTNFTTDDKALQCPAYKSINGTNIPNQSYTTEKFYKSETKTKPVDIYTSNPGNDGVCRQTCEETLTVTYGPPVATKAGLCFEYKVKVESKVNCYNEFTAPAPKPEDYTICTPTGGCNGGAYGSASGPNDEFDLCVNKCDGGKYTQKCIDKCYKKVYGTTPKLPLNYNDKVEAQQMMYNENNIKELPKEKLDYYNKIIESGPDAIGPGKQYSTEDLKIALTEAGTGYYYVSGSVIKWNMGKNRYWERPGAYYTLNIPNYTISRLQNASLCNGGNFAEYGKQCGISLIDTGSGFLRNNHGTSYCGASCSWYGCKDAIENGYYKGYPKNPGTPTNRVFLNAEDAVDVYKQEFKNYEAAAKDCMAKATCSTKTAEYTISVDNTTSNVNGKNEFKYESSIKGDGGYKNGTTLNGDPLKGDMSIILDRDGCYYEGKGKGDYYMTEWSFPGTWINNKTGKISYNKPENGNGWHYKKEKFCTNLKSEYVNGKWWEHRVLKPNGPISDAERAKIEKYNIEALVKDFGYFDWDIKLNCFYALYDYPLPNGGKGSKDNGAFDYKIRTIDLKDMFPNNKNEDVTDDPNETGREPGYNWSNSATNMKNDDYEVTPGALYQTIQQRGNEIYDQSKQNKYLDYEFYLTPADLNTIRKYSENDAGGNYNKFLGNIKVNNGIAYYESALFRNFSGNSANHRLNSKSVITLGALGVNNQLNKDDNRPELFSNEYTDEYQRFLLGGNK